jgi:hypothetical protein
MRYWWAATAREWSTQVGAPISLLWIADEDERTIRAFVAGFDFDGITVGSFTDSRRNAFQLLGVFGTPTSYLLDARGVLRFGMMGDRFPPIADARAACE